MSPGISLYIHIPFCAGKCHYCDFFSIRYNSSLADRYLQAVITEWNLVCRQLKLERYEIETIYFGGGTPSILSSKQWNYITSSLIRNLNTSPDLEFSVECNPESCSEEKVDSFYNAGVNRITFGVQSLSEKELSVSGRKHSAVRAIEVLNSPSLSCFNSIGADIIYGLPGQTTETLRETLKNLFSTSLIKHISAYELSISPKTSFGRHHNILPLPDEDTMLEMTSIVKSECIKHGFEQYEISNYAMPSFNCRHNEAYWDHREYIGLGCAAHSYFNRKRWANKADVNEYICNLEQNILPQSWVENVNDDTLAKEMIFLGLRRIRGIDEERFGILTRMNFIDCVNKEKLEIFLSTGRIAYEKPRWYATEEGLLYADGMARDLFL
jgi:oxygen-independent coproporphyrinogen-3 oxidase